MYSPSVARTYLRAGRPGDAARTTTPAALNRWVIANHPTGRTNVGNDTGRPTEMPMPTTTTTIQDDPTGFPVLHTLLLCLCKTSEAAVLCFIMPFVNQMCAGFGLDQSTSAKYAGLIESSLIFTEAIFSPIWGALADKHGRKPLLVFGLTAFTFACVGVGLSTNIWFAIASRCISGVLGAVSVLVRTVQFEIADQGSIDKVLEYLTPCWAVGAALGPMIGGLLAEPAKTMPRIFSHPIWTKFPYLLPSAATALLPATAALGCWLYLPETLGRPTAEAGSADTETSETASYPESSQGGDRDQTEGISTVRSASLTSFDETIFEDVTVRQLLTQSSLMYTCFTGSLLSFVSMAYNSGFMMMSSTALADGGLGLAPWQLGVMLGTSSVLGIVVGAFLVPAIVSRVGWYRALRITALAHVVLFPLIALTGVVARSEGRVGPLTTAVIGLVLVAYEVGETSFTGIDVAFADRAPKGCLARVNGFSLSSASVGRMVAPIKSGLLWSASIEHSSPIGRQLIWLVFTLISVVWCFSTHRLFSPKEKAARELAKKLTARGEAARAQESEHSWLIYSEEFGGVTGYGSMVVEYPEATTPSSFDSIDSFLERERAKLVARDQSP